MSLIDDVKEYYEEDSSPVYDEVYCELVEEIEGDRLRWGQQVTWILERDGEYVAVDDVAPATEMQSWGDYGKPDIYHVKKREEKVVKTFWDRVDS